MKPRTSLLLIFVFFALLCSNAYSQSILISQFYGGAGSSSGSYTRDYVDLKNISNSPQALNGLFIQRVSASGNFGSVDQQGTSSDIDLEISRSADPTSVEIGDSVTFSINVTNDGTTSATNVQARFVVPNGLTFSSATVNGGFTASESGGIVTFNNGTVAGGGSVALTVVTTASVQGFKAISAPTDVIVDPNNTIVETDETNNNASNISEVRILFPAVVTGLFGRPSLSQLMNDIADIGGAQIVRLESDLSNENSTITVPDSLAIDFGNFVVTGSGQIILGDFCTVLTSHLNGVGNSSNPGNIQLSVATSFGARTSFVYYTVFNVLPKTQVGIVPQNAYGMPTTVGNFVINNPNGVNVFEPFFVEGDLHLVDGIIYNGTNKISLSEFSRINGDINGTGSESSFVAGAIEKYAPLGSFTNLQAHGIATNFVFPVGTVGGTDNGYSPLTALNYSASDPNSSLTVQAFDAPLPNVTNPSISRYWQITENGNIVTNLRFNWRNGEDSAITIPSEVRIFRDTSNACVTDFSVLLNCTINLPANTATINDVFEFSPWGLAQLVPSSAGVSIGGRVANPQGVGIRNIEVSLIDASGNIRRVNTGTFGYFLFEDLQAGNSYTLTFQSKNYQILPRVITPSEDVLDLEIIAQE